MANFKRRREHCGRTQQAGLRRCRHRGAACAATGMAFLSTNCTFQDPYNCTAVNGCGFCLAVPFVMSNELLGHAVTVERLWPGDPAPPVPPIPGTDVVTQHLGFNGGFLSNCARTIPYGSSENDAVSACWFDLYVPAAWFACAVALSVVLLKLARDPH